MKIKYILTVAAIIGVLIVAVFSIFRQTVVVNAQDQQPPPTNDRVSFGTVGITSGQTLRVSVANTIMPSDVNLPPGPTRVLINFRYLNGNLVRNYKSGEVIRKAVDIERGDGAFLDVDYGDLPPGPIRVQIRPVIVVLPPGPTSEAQKSYPDGVVVPTIEIVDNANGRSQFAVFTHPAVVRGFNPQPDPPAEP